MCVAASCLGVSVVTSGLVLFYTLIMIHFEFQLTVYQVHLESMQNQRQFMSVLDIDLTD